MLKQISVLCSGLLTSIAMVSTTHAAGKNEITLVATVSSICEIEFDTDSREKTWSLNPTQTDEELATGDNLQAVKINFAGCPGGAETEIFLTSNEISGKGCAKASNADQSADIQFCFKDEKDDDIAVSVSGTKTSPIKADKVGEAATKEIKVYPQLGEGSDILVEGTYTGLVTVVSAIN